MATPPARGLQTSTALRPPRVLIHRPSQAIGKSTYFGVRPRAGA